ncbi:MAG TPA: calcium-binding protein [Stellaceae bacterium]|jgi:hypothetical protein|nr:calcium-binding protein [Stellaceae bacterium]
MASVTGSQLAFFAQGNSTGSNINLVLTPDGSGTLATVAGAFNIEVFTSSVGTPSLAPGFQASAFIQGAVQTGGNSVQAGTPTSIEQLLDGSFQLTNLTPGELIQIIGNGGGGSNDTVLGARNDTIIGSNNPFNVQSIFSAGVESIVGGAGSTNVFAAAFDTVVGAGGGLTVAGAASGHLSITGGVGGLTAFDLGTTNVVTGTGGTVFIDDSYAGGGDSTLTGGTGAINFLKGGIGDRLVGGNGGGTTTTIIDASLGSQTVVGGQGAVTFINSSNDLVFAGGGVSVFIASTGGDTIVGSTTANFVGVSKTDVYLAGALDSIVGASGDLDVAGSAAANLTITGGTGDLFAFNMGVNSSVVGGSGASNVINDAFFNAGGFTGGSSTLVGGGGATTIVSGINDVIIGKAGTLEARIRSDLTVAGAVETVNLSAGAVADVVRDISIAGGTGATASVTGFDTTLDSIASNTSTGAQLVASAGTDGSGNVVLNFNDGTTMTLIGVTNVNAITFTS